MSVSGDDFRLDIKYNGDPIAEEYHAVRQKKHIEKILGGNLWIEIYRILIFIRYNIQGSGGLLCLIN